MQQIGRVTLEPELQADLFQDLVSMVEADGLKRMS